MCTPQGGKRRSIEEMRPKRGIAVGQSCMDTGAQWDQTWAMSSAAGKSGFAALWHKVTRIGVSDQLPPTEAKYVILNNTLVLFMSGLALAVIPINYLSTGVEQPLVTLALPLIQAPMFMISLVLSAKGHGYLASLWFGTVAAATLLGQTWIIGRATGIHFFFLLHAVGPFVLVPPRYHLWVFAQSGLYFACFLFALIGVPATPLVHFSPAMTETLLDGNLIFTFISLVAFGYYERTNTLAAEAEVERERQRAESLLLNILPAQIAERLKRDTSPIADGFAEVTVLFADIAGFTPLASKLQPAELVGMLNQIFSEFDAMAEKHGLEKIKTIGDAYMAAAGLPVQRPDHAQAVADMALDMITAVAKVKTPDGSQLHMRIGIHTGPVVAGVIGKRKFIYDLWGDTVNLAARMESHGEADRVHMTQVTADKISAEFDCEDRGFVAIKGKGEVRCFWLIGRKR